jgi:oligopeptide/dipeptide ABC transporter ATP-binding protein
MNPKSNQIVRIEDVRKVYKAKGSFFGARKKDVVALDGVSLTIPRGEIFGLVGESGSGKTTLGRLLIGLEETNSGKLFLDEEEVTHLRGKELKRFRRKVQMIFQDPYQSLNPQRSVFDTVSEPLKIHKLGLGSDKYEKTRQALQAVGLAPPDDYLHRYPHRLSGGQRQRVAIARAMILNPEFVIADEPTSMLDASISAQIFNILLKMRTDFDVTMLFITHSLAAARYLCDRIAVIYRGNLMEIGPGEEVIGNPMHPYTKALLDAIPKFGQKKVMKRYGTLLSREREDANGSGCAFFSRCKVADEGQCSMTKPVLNERSKGHQAACFF